MRQNFDYVTMDDYTSDLAEVSQTASAIIDRQRREIQDLKFMFSAAVMAAGGKICIANGYLHAIENIELTAFIDLDKNARVFTAKWREPIRGFDKTRNP